MGTGEDASGATPEGSPASAPVWLKGRTTMIRALPLAAGAAALSLAAPHAFAQGVVEKAVGGYSFEDAAAEAPGTKDFHSADGHLTFAIVTHTAGNGFFDPVYVG